MHQCCVFGCKNQANHSFPRDLNVRKLWEAAIRRKTKTSSKICNAHFKSEDFIKVGKYSGLYNTRRILKKGIVPSVFHWTKTQDRKYKNRRKQAEEQDPLAVPKPVKHETPKHVVPTFSQLSAPKEVPIEPFVPEDDDYRCKDCAADTDGFSWWCVQCSRGALCGACALRPPHDAHYMLRAPQGATDSQTQAVLAVIRQQLQNENLLPLCDVEKLGVKLEIKLEPEDPPSPLPEPVLDAMLETVLDSEPDPVLDVTLDREPAFDTLLEATVDPAMESDPLSTESDDAGNEVAEMNEDKELEEYLAKRQRYMETIKPYCNKTISADPEPSLDPVLDTTPDPVLDTVDLTMEPDPLTTEPDDAEKEVYEYENKELEEYLAKRQRFMETITPYQKKKIFRYNPRSPNSLKTMPDEETALKDNPGGYQTLQTPVFLHLYSSSNLEGSQNLQAPNPTGSQTQQVPSNIKRVETLQTPSNLRGSQTVRVPSSLRGSQTVRVPSSLRGSQTVRVPSSLRGSQTVRVPSSLRESQSERAPSNLRGSQTQQTPSSIKRVESLQTPSNLRGSQTVRVPSSLRGSQTVRVPSSLRGSQTVRAPSNLRGSQTVQVPSSLRGSHTVRSPSNIRGSQTQQTPSNIKRVETLQTPSTPGGSRLTVLKVMPSELVRSSTAKTSPGSSQTVSKPNSQKIKRTIFKVPVSELGKSKTIHFSDSSLKSIRKVRPSELLKIKKVQNVLKNTALTQENDSKELKLRNILKGCSIPLKVTSGPPQYKH